MARLMLFIDLRHPVGTSAIGAVERLLGEFGDIAFELDIKDVANEAEAAETHQVFATPTLLRLDVDPARRVVGDLSDTNRVSTELGLA